MELILLRREDIDQELGEGNYFTVSPTQLDVWFTCHYKWKLSYLDGFQARPGGPTNAMLQGTIFHEFMKATYDLYISEGSGIRPLTEEEIIGIKDPIEKRYTKYEELILFYNAYKVWIRYLRWAYREDDFVPLMTEQELFVPVTKKKGKTVFLHGFLDLVAERRGELGVVDHKTYNSEKARWTAPLVNFDLQLAMYMVMLWKVRITPEWGCINGVNTHPYKNLGAEPDSKLFNREYTYKDTRQLQGYLDNIMALIDEMFDPKFYPKRAKKDCEYCGYSQVCDMELRGLPSKEFLELRHSKEVTLDDDIDIDLESLVSTEDD